jgi:hypothetical protein
LVTFGKRSSRTDLLPGHVDYTIFSSPDRPPLTVDSLLRTRSRESSLRRSWVLVSVAILLLAVVTLARGFAFVHSHGSLQVDVNDVSATDRIARVVPLEVTFFDSSGRALARTTADSATGGTSYVTFPAGYACHSVELRAATDLNARREWSICFERQSRWLMTWAADARFVDVEARPCSLHRVPFTMKMTPEDWWLWWVPLRHVGGDPYTYLAAEIQFNRSQCTARN